VLSCEARPAILVVEDEPTVAALLVTLLRDEGYAVTLARSGAEAVRLLDQDYSPPVALPSLVLLDVMLPGTNGLDILRLLGLQQSAVPVIALSAYAEALPAAAHLGAVATLGKPFDLDELLATIARFCGPGRRA
jgi:DNA-binding response OmpR family regulator